MIASLRRSVWRLARWLLFKLDAEAAHQLSVRLIRSGIFLRNVPLHLMSGVPMQKKPSEAFPHVFGVPFSSRVGLAAGFDKNAEILVGCPALGFGFAEIGTVTPRPQAGNDLPRLFRDPARLSLFNRMGFNNLGAQIVAEHIRQARPKLPSTFRVGVNLGKNKDTEIEHASDDYVVAAQYFAGLADYLVINVSSPNTPGLRALQSVEALKPIIAGVLELTQGWIKKPPLLVKIAPEVIDLSLKSLIQDLEPHGIDGWVLTNTLAGSYSTPVDLLPRPLIAVHREQFAGGWSGQVLTESSRRSLLEARSLTQKPIISVGGILSKEEAVARISAGADLVQIYTGWIYGGPTFPMSLG